MTKASKKLVKGFGLGEVLLVVVVLAIVAFTSWYIYQANNQATDEYDKANEAASSVVMKGDKMSAATEACTTGGYKGNATTIAKSGFDFCVPAGWTLYSPDGDPGFYVAGFDSLHYDASKKGEVTVSKGSDNNWPLAISYHTASDFAKGDQSQLKNYTQVTAPKLTNGAGLTVAAYYHLTGKNDPVGAGVESLPEGTKQYLYVVSMPASMADMSTVLEISYHTEADQPDILPLVQALVSGVSMPADMAM